MYIDPSAGGMIFQVLAVAFGVISGGVLLFSSRIKMGVATMRRRLRERNQKSSIPADGQSNSDAAEK